MSVIVKLEYFKSQKALSLTDKNVKAALPTTSDSHAASLLPAPRQGVVGLSESGPPAATNVIQTRCATFEKKS